MTNDHFSILNFQFTSKDRWPSPLMQPQQNLTCLQRLLVFKGLRLFSDFAEKRRFAFGEQPMTATGWSFAQ